MLGVTSKPFLLSVVMVNVVMLNVFDLSVLTPKLRPLQNRLSRHAPMKYFQNALAYFAMAVSYTRNMYMKYSPVVNYEELFFSLSLMLPQNKLECLTLERIFRLG
jgi:hypothetical protein